MVHLWGIVHAVQVTPYYLEILGPLRLSYDGRRIDIPSRRGQVLLAMLATSPSGERTRAWLQDRLWGSRPTAQAQASLRRELSSLRKLINRDSHELIHADHLRLWLDKELITVETGGIGGEFLEGIDLPGEEGFEDWLREHRTQQTTAPPISPRPKPPTVARGALSSVKIVSFAGSERASDAIAERLARIRWLWLSAEGDSNAARFELTGHSHNSDNLVRTVSMTLIDRADGRLLWSGRFAEDEFTARPPCAADEAVSAIRSRIAQAEQNAAITEKSSDNAALIWQSQWHMHRLNREDATRAAHLAGLALAADPHGIEAIAQGAWVRLWDLWVTRASGSAIREVREQAQRAIITDHEDARGHMLAGIAEIWLMQPLRAEALLRRAVELDPSLVMARVQLACALYHRLRLAEAEAELKIALRLSPNDQYLFFIAGELATTCLMQGKWDEALLHAETSLAARQAYIHGHVAKVNALIRLGRMAEARIAHKELYLANPGYKPSFIEWIPFLDSTWHEFFKEGLNRAAAASD